MNPYAQMPSIIQNKQTGQLLVNRSKYAQKPFWLPANPYGISTAANGRSRTSFFPPADQGGAGDAEFYQLCSQSTGACAVMLNAAILNRRLMNVPIESTLVFGTAAQLPGELVAPVLVPATTSIDAEITDLSGSTNTVYLTAISGQVVDPMGTLGMTPFDAQRAYISRDTHPYWLGTDTGSQVTAAANTTTTFTCTIPPMCDFEAWALLARVSGTSSNLTIEIKEGNRRSLMGGTPVLLDHVASLTRSVTGFAGNLVPAVALPAKWAFTWLAQRGTQVQLLVTNSSSAQTCSFAFIGRLIYYPPSAPVSSVPVPTDMSFRFANQPR